ncbi:pirin family protein [Parapedobacter sp. ISTM3]|uniref:pirin family protein n=1 Tax=Parapedobacter sp. ISTM3 TaxID=2800130 RepID=UPI001908D877|nr:pirin family protein [Parapedobacter sp. ISTM3]MBK1441322.1 pirin family protein [Parapedobacter sp. ISTM3]
MSNVGMIIEERPADIGNFMVGRLLPFRGKRMVGPYIFIDHMGPAKLSDTQNVDVPPHPHIGLSTLTYLFEGSMMHRDSLGTAMEIQPGAVNWMTAGRGVVHSERTPEYLRHSDKSLHGLQIWVAMPKELENSEPSFHHVEAKDIPYWEEGHVTFRLIAGEAFGRRSPVPVHSRQFFLEIHSTADQQLDIGRELFGESGLYILKGSIASDGHTYSPRQILVAKEATLCTFTIHADTSIYIFGGDPFPEERHIYWNFVSTKRETIEAAKQRWLEQRFDPVPGETEFVPLPEQAQRPRQTGPTE